MADLSALKADVEEETTVVQSVVTLLDGLSAAVADLKTKVESPEAQKAIDDLDASVRSNRQALADAVAKNTPAA